MITPKEYKKAVSKYYLYSILMFIIFGVMPSVGAYYYNAWIGKNVEIFITVFFILLVILFSLTNITDRFNENAEIKKRYEKEQRKF
jgi:uncharacterized membrane protein YhaH (DUF805 family)